MGKNIQASEIGESAKKEKVIKLPQEAEFANYILFKVENDPMEKIRLN